MGDPVFITIPISAAVLVAGRRDLPVFRPGDRVSYGELEGTVLKAVPEGSIPRYLVEWDGDWRGASNRGILAGWQLSPIDPQLGIQFKASQIVKTAISLPELVRQTNAFSKKYRPGCTPSLLDSNPKALFLHYNVKCNKEDSDPAGHDVRVQFDVTKVQESQQAKDLDVQVSCSCPAFLYWGAQWNLHQRDGLLGTPRPKLVAPTERLDLRGNFVICKHIHSVFERILPSVQHNIVKILREREVRKNKEKMRQTPSKLKERQEEMRKRKEKEKILKIKDKKIRDKMLESLKNEEEARRLHEQQLENQGKTPGPEEVEREAPALSPEEQAVVEAPELAPEPKEDNLSAIQDLLKQEEAKVEEAHKEGLPHLHKGLPYDVEPEEDEDKLIHKFESLILDRKVATRITVPGIGMLEEGMTVIAITGSGLIRGQQIKSIDRNKERPEYSMVWLTDGRGVRADMIRLPQGSLF